MKLKQRVSIQEEMYVCVMAETVEDPAVSDNSMWLVTLLSCDLFCFFTLKGYWDLAKPFPGHICFCVVRRDRDDDAVIYGLDFSLISAQLVSLHFCPSVYPSPVLGERDRRKELNVMAQVQRERETDKRRIDETRGKLFTLFSW